MIAFDGTRLAHAFLKVVREHFADNNIKAMNMCISAQRHIRNFVQNDSLSNMKGYITDNILKIKDDAEREVVTSYLLINAYQNVNMKDLLYFNDDLLELMPDKKLNQAFVDNIIKLHLVIMPPDIDWQKMEAWLWLRQQHFGKELQQYVYNDIFLRFLPDDAQRQFIRLDFADDTTPATPNKMFPLKHGSDGRPLNGFITFVTLCAKMFYELYHNKHDEDGNKIAFKDTMRCIAAFLNVDFGEYSHFISANKESQWFTDFFEHFKGVANKSKLILIYVIVYCTCTVQLCVTYDYID
jgi:hypothetical protein